ncbi:MAG: hypothetical protein JHC98_06035 [Thermoleophilaceae bacterium]|nr:hypothetical protein [Thermoleophilaceae bacterium]
MDLYLQAGFNAQVMCRELLSDWGGGTVILSPRDANISDLTNYSQQMRDAGGSVLLDPQMFRADSNYERLTDHEHWYVDLDSDVNAALVGLRNINSSLETRAVILPGRYVDLNGLPAWIDQQRAVTEASADVLEGKDRWATICMGAEVVRNRQPISRIADVATTWNVDGYYVVAEPPANQYLVSDALWLSNLISFLAGIKLTGRKVVLGYAHQQMLIAAAANIDAIASGNFKNVRSFGVDKFFVGDDDAMARQAPYFYSPRTLSEYPISSLDLAQQVGMLDDLRLSVEFQNSYSDILFTGAQPSTVDYKLARSWRHFLRALRVQATSARKETFRDTTAGLELQMAEAISAHESLSGVGVLPATGRDFSEVANTGKAALRILERQRGFVLDRRWL